MDAERLLSNNETLAPYGTNRPIESIPNEDLHENANQTQPLPSAPPLSHMDQLAGYDNMHFDNCKNAV